MYMELLIGGSLAAFTIYAAAKWQKTDKEKIQITFKNINYQVNDYKPNLLRAIKKELSTEYVYNVPYGLIDDPNLQPILQKTLDKPVHVYFDGKLHVRVYNSRMPIRIEYEWNKTKGWTISIGQTLEHTIIHDFDKIPHMTIAGMTRQGKTVLLKLIMAHLIYNHSSDVNFYIIDLKGGLEFGPYEKLKQVKGVASNVNEAQRLLKEVSNNIKSDMQHFKQKGYTNVLDTPIKKRTFIIVDEAAELMPGSHLDKDEKKPYKYCQEILSEVARVAGALGYRNIFCTQYPTADTLPRQIKQNSDAKISFRLPTEVASRVAIDEQGAEKLNNIGRAIYRTHEKHVVQVPYIKDSDIKDKLGGYFNDDSADKESATPRTDIIEFG